MTDFNIYRGKLIFRLLQVVHIVLLVFSLLMIILLTQHNIPRKSNVLDFDITGAKQAGYTDIEIDEYIDSKKKYSINWTGDWSSFLTPALLSIGWSYFLLGLFRETIFYILFGKKIKALDVFRFWGR